MNVNLKQRFQEILEDNRILEAELMMPRQEIFYLELLQLQERHR